VTATRTLRQLIALAGLPRGRVVLVIALGSLAVGFGVALLTAAGYLISRAAELPPILSLTTIVVVVRFLALARPLARYLERLASHDLALCALGRIRASVYQRIEPLAPAELSAFRRGDLVSRLVADVDDLQGLYLRGLGPPLVALAVAITCVVAVAFALPAAALALAIGLALGGLAVPVLAALLGRHVGCRRAPARGELTAELVETLRGAEELAAYGREDDAVARVRDADRALVRLGEWQTSITVSVDEVGRATEVVLDRWGDLTPDKSFRLIPYGATVGGEATYGNYTIPTKISVGWWYGTPDYVEVIRLKVDWIQYL